MVLAGSSHSAHTHHWVTRRQCQDDGDDGHIIIIILCVCCVRVCVCVCTRLCVCSCIASVQGLTPAPVARNVTPGCRGLIMPLAASGLSPFAGQGV